MADTWRRSRRQWKLQGKMGTAPHQRWPQAPPCLGNGWAGSADLFFCWNSGRQVLEAKLNIFLVGNLPILGDVYLAQKPFGDLYLYQTKQLFGG